jgi:PQQ-dependent catabolism-associated CXXCW motif protein
VLGHRWVGAAILSAAAVALLGAGSADITDVATVPYLGEKGRAAYAGFLTRGHQRAFAIAPNGAWGYSSGRNTERDAIAVALYQCNRAAHDVCRVYAVNDFVVHADYRSFDDASRDILTRLPAASLSRPEYGEELRDFGAPSPETLRARDYHADTPVGLGGVRTVTTVQLRDMMISPAPPIVIDVLEGDPHPTLPGAVWIRGAGRDAGSAEANARVLELLRDVLGGLTGGDTSRPIALFCLDSRCWLSHNAALRARQLGYTGVHWYRGGTKAWTAAGLETTPSVQHGQVQ